jgi:hypothetical protein
MSPRVVLYLYAQEILFQVMEKYKLKLPFFHPKTRKTRPIWNTTANFVKSKLDFIAQKKCGGVCVLCVVCGGVCKLSSKIVVFYSQPPTPQQNRSAGAAPPGLDRYYTPLLLFVLPVLNYYYYSIITTVI